MNTPEDVQWALAVVTAAAADDADAFTRLLCDVTIGGVCALSGMAVGALSSLAASEGRTVADLLQEGGLALANLRESS